MVDVTVNVKVDERVVADDRLDPARDRDRGSASLAIVLLTPVLVVLMFAGFQAALWNHARAQARAVARDTAVLIARNHLPPDQATTTAEASLGELHITDIHVTVTQGALTVVTVTGHAEGILRGTSWAIAVTVGEPTEGWVPL